MNSYKVTAQAYQMQEFPIFFKGGQNKKKPSGHLGPEGFLLIAN